MHVVSPRAHKAGDLLYKAYWLGTHRSVSAEETVARLRPLMAAMGITRVANLTGLDRVGVPVVAVYRPNARSIAVAQGKGLTLDAAKASGIMEATETFHAERIDRPLKLSSLEEMSTRNRLVDMDRLSLPADSRFQPSLSMLWIEGQDLVGETSVWLPYELVHTNFTFPLPPGTGCFGVSTNGLASGNHWLEAVCHGICEVVERDATSVWRAMPAAKRAATRLDLATVDDLACQDLLHKFAVARLNAAAWETTTDVGIPAFYAVVIDELRPDAHPGIGAGCHAAKAIALLRALTEAAQVRMTYISGARDDLLPAEYSAAAQAAKVREASLLLRTRAPTREFRAVRSQQAETFEDELRWLLGMLVAAGIEQVIAVDLTRTEFGVAVVRIVIPGLEAPDGHHSYQPGPRAHAVSGDAA